MIKIPRGKQFGEEEERVYLAYRLQCIIREEAKTGIQGMKLEVGTEAAATAAHAALVSYTTQDPFSRVGTVHSNIGPPMVINQENAS